MTSILLTDAYKFSMAEAGYPLREETFYYSHRKGGWAFLPFDPAQEITKLLPTVTDHALEWLSTHGYPLSSGTLAAFRGPIRVSSIPKGSWFYEREPVFSVTGPSALVSWLEPQILQLHYRIQAATAWKLSGYVQRVVTCPDEADLLHAIYSEYGSLSAENTRIENHSGDYMAHVTERGKTILQLLGGDGRRVFEVGMRAASCQEQHQMAVAALVQMGITRTSNVASAFTVCVDPVGTMGHEHVQRFGSSLRAFRAMRERLPGFLSYLPDTYSTLDEGVPAALRVLDEDLGNLNAIRFDSDAWAKEHYISTICRLRARGREARLLLESGWNDSKTAEFEKLRVLLDWPADLQGYGIGGWFVDPPWKTFRRNDVAAVYKLSFSGRPVRKRGDEPGGGKASIPGKPVLWRGHLGESGYDGPVGWVCQEGEAWAPPRATRLTGGEVPRWLRFSPEEIKGFNVQPIAYSPETQRAMAQCNVEMQQALLEAREVIRD